MHTTIPRFLCENWRSKLQSSWIKLFTHWAPGYKLLCFMKYASSCGWTKMSEAYSFKPQDFVSELAIKGSSNKFQGSTRPLSHSFSPPLPFEHMLYKIPNSSCHVQRKSYSRYSGAHSPLPKEPFPYQSEGTNGYLRQLLAYQSIYWPPGSLSTSGSSQLFSLRLVP